MALSVLNRVNKALNVFKVSPQSTVREAVGMMVEKKVGCVMVIENDALVGIFTERDLLNRVLAKDLPPETTKISEVMSKNVGTVNEGDSLEKCYEKMQTVKARHIPILKDGSVVGVVSMRDITETLMKEIKDENIHLKNYIQNP